MIGGKNTDWTNFLREYKGLSMPIEDISKEYRLKKSKEGITITKPFRSHCSKLSADDCATMSECGLTKGYKKQTGKYINPFCRGKHSNLVYQYLSDPSKYPANNQISREEYVSPKSRTRSRKTQLTRSSNNCESFNTEDNLQKRERVCRNSDTCVWNTGNHKCIYDPNKTLFQIDTPTDTSKTQNVGQQPSDVYWKHQPVDDFPSKQPLKSQQPQQSQQPHQLLQQQPHQLLQQPQQQQL